MKTLVAVMLALISAVPNIKTEAKAYAVIERTSGRILCEMNGQAKMPMASTTKVMTALLVIENLDLDKTYTVPDESVGIEGSSIYLQKGEELTGRELLYGLMLASGNDSAYALAVLTGGSVENFVAQMNERAKDMNLNNTHFADPCGLASKNHYTTACDLARLCAFAMENETFRETVGTQNKQISGKNGTRYLFNKNRILGEFSGGNGIKTGYTVASGRCLCASAMRNGMELICVVLNDRNWFSDCENLMEWGFNEYSLVQLAKKGEIAGKINIYGGKEEKCDIIYARDVFYPLKANERAVGESKGIALTAPVKAGDTGGGCEFYLCGEKIAETELLCAKDVQKKKSLFGR